MNAAYQRDGATYYNGDMTQPELMEGAVSVSRIQQLVKSGVPAPESLRAFEMISSTKGLLFFKEGKYELKDNKGKSSQFSVTGLGKEIDLNDNWKVTFPPNLGAPSQITLDKLMSLHNHQEDGVKFFSGTATYTKQFNIPAAALAANKRLFLDLGRVEVLAEVKVNGKSLGIVWKPPYRVDITESAKPGNNFVEIAVTNLWPNRLIGDEKLPEEAEYVSGGNAVRFSVLSNGAIKKLPDWYT
ncbi:MAG: glycosylhydrolase-like jelly roll fold domain-containing protein [Segetibacter sp.]